MTRAKIILPTASGKTNLQIARQLELTNATVGKWRRRADTMPAASPASGLSGFPTGDRKERAGDIACAHHRGQLCHPQTSASKTLARSTPRFYVHFTPTYASWLDHVEIWFNRITQQAIRRGTFRSVKGLVEKICGPPLRIRSSPKSSDYVNVFPGRDTSFVRCSECPPSRCPQLFGL